MTFERTIAGFLECHTNMICLSMLVRKRKVKGEVHGKFKETAKLCALVIEVNESDKLIIPKEIKLVSVLFTMPIYCDFCECWFSSISSKAFISMTISIGEFYHKEKLTIFQKIFFFFIYNTQ